MTDTPSMIRVSGPSVQTSGPVAMQAVSDTSAGQLPSLRVSVTSRVPSFLRYTVPVA